MAEFAKYYLDFLWNLLQNFWGFIYGTFSPLVFIFTKDIPFYFNQLAQAVPGFGVIGWICYIIVTVINLVFFGFVSYLGYLFLRRYVFYRSKHVEKDVLVQEIAKLKIQVADLTREKNQLFAMKLGVGLGMEEERRQEALSAAGGDLPVPEKSTAPKKASRFSKLTLIDEQFEENPVHIFMADADRITLDAIVQRFINFAASQLKLYYVPHTVRCFISGMATTKVLILEGISGTGKTSLPYAMGRFFNHPTTICSVQPSWRDRADLLGYFNEFSKMYNETDFLASVYEATYRDDPSFIILDEMNLARIEYYFAEFLSIMEMPDVSEWLVDLTTHGIEGDPANLDDGKLLVPQNLWFVGTANNDDSTFTITDKVYDRTIAIDLNQRGEPLDAPVTPSYYCTAEYLEQLFAAAKKEHPMTDKIRKSIKELDEFVTTKLKVTFGNRIMRQFGAFIPTYIACGGTELEALDFLLMSKVFRKFTQLNLAFLQKELQELIGVLDKLFGKGVMKRCIDYINYLIRMS